jgi:FixJ family two-component response regulator
VRQSARISIVDDDEDVRFAIQNFLRSAGCDVRTFDNADEFLGSLEGGAPDCLVTDLHMPGMGGLSLQEELNRLGRSFPVIVMTAFPTLEAEERSAELGASAFLSKPIDPEQLLRLVETNLGGFDD